MPEFYILKDGSFLRIADGAHIPRAPGNHDYEALVVAFKANPAVVAAAPVVKPLAH